MAELRIGTRQSPLALCQARQVQAALLPDTPARLVPMVSEGDRRLDLALHELGGKGVFLKELEQALLSGQIDLAVHSLKDMPAELPAGLTLAAIPERAHPGDALVASKPLTLADLPAGARVGTSSLRRQCQMQQIRPDLQLAAIRGNIGTRLKHLESGQFDALILAAAGLQRLGLQDRISAELPPHICLPAAGQGALAIETRADDDRINPLIAALNHPVTAACCQAERSVLAALECGCHAPVAAFAEARGAELHLRALLGSADLSRILTAEQTGRLDAPLQLGRRVADQLLAQGAAEWLQQSA